MLDPFPSCCSTPPNSLRLTGIRRNSCTTPPGGMLFGHLAESSLHTGYEPKTCIDLSIEHTSINYPSMRNSFNIENELTTTVASSENSDGFHQQAAVSGIPQPVPPSVVNPWLSADMWSSTRKPVRGNASIASVEGTLSRGKENRDLESLQTLLERCNLHVYLEHEAELGLFKENKQLKEDYQRLKQTWKRNWDQKKFGYCPLLNQSRAPISKIWNCIRRINGQLKLKREKISLSGDLEMRSRIYQESHTRILPKI